MDSFKKEKQKIWHIWPAFPPGSQQPGWQLPASYLQVCGLQLTTTLPGPLRFFDISYLPSLWTWIWRPWITYCLQPQTPWLHSPLFLLQLVPLSFISMDFLISIVSKEQISSSFPNFFFPFQLIHPPFLPLSPSHPTELPSQKLENAFGILKYEARFSQNEYRWYFFCKDYT